VSDKKILLIDGYNAAWRLMHKLPPLSVNGQDIQIVYGFIRLLRGVIEQFEPNAALVIWDSGHSEFRKKVYPGYKDRHHDRIHEKQYHSLTSQISILDDILANLNVGVVAWPGTEADDLIGLSCDGLSGLKIIVSADQDMLQLVDSDVQVWSPMKSELYTDKNFQKLIGMTPRQYLEMKALIGDGSDKIGGVARGFGEATARELILKYGCIEELYSPKVEKKVYNQGNRYKLLYNEGAKEIVYRNLILMDLSVCGHGIKNKEEAIKRIKHVVRFRNKIDKAQVKRIFIEKAFKSLLEDFGRWVTPFEILDWQEQE